MCVREKETERDRQNDWRSQDFIRSTPGTTQVANASKVVLINKYAGLVPWLMDFNPKIGVP